MSMFENKKILITGGTGSLGQALTKKLLETKVDIIRIFSRDELKQTQMRQDFNDNRLRFLIGDVRDKERLLRALEDIDIVIHAAALKHVPVVQYNPFEAVKTNVYGSQNLIEACLDKGVKTVLAVGTDKAVSPFNTYGATKLLMERCFVSANFYKGNHDVRFICVRYGNVLGSRGSIVPSVLNQIQKNKPITVTDPTMTRFNITMNQAVDLVLRALKNGTGGDIFIPKLKAYKVGDMIEAITDILEVKTKIQKIDVRPGEKFHEALMNTDELRNVYELEEDYIIFDKDTQNHELDSSIPKTMRDNQYSSDKVELLSKQEIKEILQKEKLVSKIN